MRCERTVLGPDVRAAAANVRALAPAAGDVAEAVAEIVAAVRTGGDDALRELTARFDTGGSEPRAVLVGAEELAAAREALAPDVVAALARAVENVRLVAQAGVGEGRDVTLPDGQRVVLREVPVRSAAVYVPGGRAPYPSTVVMGAVTARAAGVERVVVCAPPGQDGEIDPVILGACALCGVDAVYRMGGAQAVAALALGTEAIERVDVIVGPGNLYVQEAKRQLCAEVGIDGFAGPSDVLVLLGDGADVELAALDLLAQGEHGEGTLCVAVTPDAAQLDELEAALHALAADRPGSQPSAFVLVQAAHFEDAFAFAEAFAPEHLELVGAGAEELAPRVRSAGCVFVGAAGATAFGDYIAGSNHVLPTNGAARFASALSPRAFRRRFTEVHVGEAAAALAPAGATIAHAEGFDIHAESMRARIRENGEPR